MVVSSDTQIGCFLENIVFDREILGMNEEEEDMVKIILVFLYSSFSTDIFKHIRLERRCKSYVSMFYGGNNFLRFKYSKMAKWISLALPHDLAVANMENPLFAAQKNKRQFHWRADLGSLDDLNKLRDYIVASCVYLPDPE